jgi:hypothetical protein
MKKIIIALALISSPACASQLGPLDIHNARIACIDAGERGSPGRGQCCPGYVAFQVAGLHGHFNVSHVEASRLVYSHPAWAAEAKKLAKVCEEGVK